jgi:sugar transferase (PEP-CTERM system associated)
VKIRVFRHYVHAPVWILALIEAGIFFASIYVGAQLRFIEYSGVGIEELGPLLPRAIILTFTMFVVMMSMGLYRSDMKLEDRSYRSLFISSFAVGFLTITAIFYVVPNLHLGRGVLGIAFLIAAAASALTRYLFIKLQDSTVTKRRILVLGSGSRAARIAEIAKERNGDNRFHLVGFALRGTADERIDKSLLLPEDAPLIALCRKHHVDEIVVGIRQRRGGHVHMDELLECRMEGIQVTDLSSFFERETGKVQLESLNPSWIVYCEGFNRSDIRNIVKRMFDVSVSIFLLLLTLPVLLLTAILIKLESRGPVFYRQRRIGECGHPFDVIKFRSMRTDAEVDGKPQWAQKNDNRVTKVGWLIRKLRIDELPQILNVLKGDMSFVGPRPERPFFINQFVGHIPYYLTRHSVKPGITGWAQVRYPYGASIEDAKQKLQYDLYYAKNHTLFLDLVILFETAQVVLFGKGAR